MISSLTTALDESRRENDVLKTDNATVKDENKQLTTLLDKIAVNNENQIQQINSQSSEIAKIKDKIEQLKTENDLIKAENVQLKMRHVDTSKSQHPPPVSPKAIEHKVKVSTSVVRDHTSSLRNNPHINYTGVEEPKSWGSKFIIRRNKEVLYSWS